MSEAEKGIVSFEVENRIAWVRFNRPAKRNCMSPKLNRRMLDVLDELEFRDDVGVLVLTGEGIGLVGRHGPQGIFPGDRGAGPAGHPPLTARGLCLVAAAALVPEADHRHGQRLVLRRRLWPALRL